MSARAIKILITIIAISLAAIHFIWPHLALDGVTATLVVVAVLPWLSSVFKSIELPGGVKVEYQDFEKIEERARETGLLSEETQTAQQEYTFQKIAPTDPNLALAGLRLELERRLIRLAESRSINLPRVGLTQVLRILNQHQLINGEERALLSDLAALLNSAVHGASVTSSAVQWALDIGPQILQALDKRAGTTDVNYEGIT